MNHLLRGKLDALESNIVPPSSTTTPFRGNVLHCDVFKVRTHFQQHVVAVLRLGLRCASSGLGAAQDASNDSLLFEWKFADRDFFTNNQFAQRAWVIVRWLGPEERVRVPFAELFTSAT